MDAEARSEAVVDADADQIGLEADVVRRDTAAGHAAVELAEVGVEIFDLGRPVAAEGVFDADAGGPADLRLADRGAGGVDRLDVAVGGAGGDVRQPAVPAGKAEAGARGAEPVVLGRASAARTGGVALHAGPVEVGFDAPDPGAGLEIIAEGAAHQPPLRI